MLNFYADQNFHGGVIDGLRLGGINCITAEKDGHAKAKDPVILMRATLLMRTVLTHDTDLIDIAWHWVADGTSFHGVVYVLQNTMPVGQIISDVLMIAQIVSNEEIQNTIWRLPL